uniref:Uncharacterized protein n=1 Tax=Arundo donax TaxID=35708 RepID=A0A0A9GTP7_ARUDO
MNSKVLHVLLNFQLCPLPLVLGNELD